MQVMQVVQVVQVVQVMQVVQVVQERGSPHPPALVSFSIVHEIPNTNVPMCQYANVCRRHPYGTNGEI